jgi:hypothetical protein
VFTRANKVGAQTAYLKSSGSEAGDWFGHDVALPGEMGDALPRIKLFSDNW